MITQEISGKIAEAMKARDEVLLSTLKMLSSALAYEKIAKQHELSGEEELAVVRREAKKRKDAIEVYKSLSPSISISERIKKEEEELKILEGYLPAQMSDEELEKLVDEAISHTGASSMSDMGKVIGVVMAKAKGMADGARVSALAKEKLSEK